jgi:hypothetical protein
MEPHMVGREHPIDLDALDTRDQPLGAAEPTGYDQVPRRTSDRCEPHRIRRNIRWRYVGPVKYGERRLPATGSDGDALAIGGGASTDIPTSGARMG